MNDSYMGYSITAQQDKDVIWWELYFDGRFIVQDFRTIDGGKLQSIPHAVNDAKKNVDAFYRLKINETT